MKELIQVRVQYASRHQWCKTHKRPLPFTFYTRVGLFIHPFYLKMKIHLICESSWFSYSKSYKLYKGLKYDGASAYLQVLEKNSTVDAKFLFTLVVAPFMGYEQNIKSRRSRFIFLTHDYISSFYFPNLTYVSEAWEQLSFRGARMLYLWAQKTEVDFCVNCSLKLSGLSEYWNGSTVVCNVLQISKFGQISSLVLGLFSTSIQKDGENDFNIRSACKVNRGQTRDFCCTATAKLYNRNARPMRGSGIDEKARFRTNGLSDCNPPVVRYSWWENVIFRDRCCGVAFIFCSKKEAIRRNWRNLNLYREK